MKAHFSKIAGESGTSVYTAIERIAIDNSAMSVRENNSSLLTDVVGLHEFMVTSVIAIDGTEYDLLCINELTESTVIHFQVNGEEVALPLFPLEYVELDLRTNQLRLNNGEKTEYHSFIPTDDLVLTISK